LEARQYDCSIGALMIVVEVREVFGGAPSEQKADQAERQTREIDACRAEMLAHVAQRGGKIVREHVGS
jgi:hypothetical protein